MRTSDKNGAQKRAAPRIKIFLAGEIRCGAGEPRRAHLLNISTGGALVYADAVPDIGEELRLACGVPLGLARVQWRNGRRFGVAFMQPISDALIDAIVRKQETLIESTCQRLGSTAVR